MNTHQENLSIESIKEHLEELSEKAIKAHTEGNIPLYEHLKANMAYLERKHDALLLEQPRYVMKNYTLPSGKLIEYLLINSLGRVTHRVTTSYEGLCEYLERFPQELESITPMGYLRIQRKGERYEKQEKQCNSST